MRSLVLLFFVICCALCIGALLARPDVFAFPLVGGVIALITLGLVPSARQMEARNIAHRLSQFHEHAASLANRPDAFDAMRRKQAELGLSDDSVRFYFKAVESWRAEHARGEFIRTFAAEFPKGPSAWARVEQLARDRKRDKHFPEHMEALAAATALSRFESAIEMNGGLPSIDDTSGLAGKDEVHFIGDALYDKRGDNDERGLLVLTNKRVLFGGTRPTLVPWSKIQFSRRDGRDLLLQRNDRQTPTVFRFDSLIELLKAERVCCSLIGEKARPFVPPPHLLAVPSVPGSPALPANNAASPPRGAAVPVTIGLGLASLVLVSGVPQALNPTPTTTRTPSPTQSAQATGGPYTVAGTPPNTAFVVVTMEAAVSDEILLRIASNVHKPNLPPLKVMFWVDPKMAPYKLPLTEAHLKERVGVVSVGGPGKPTLSRNKDWYPTQRK